ncbi:MAG: hypothetical protein SNJ60_07050 [Pseudanabaenaceae cyanobacterium]
MQAAAGSVVSVQGEWQAANPGASHPEVQLQAGGALRGRPGARPVALQARRPSPWVQELETFPVGA